MDVLKFLGDVVLLNAKDEGVTIEQLLKRSGVVGLYFAAHWCAPCRAFTPELKTFYENFKKSSRNEQFDVVFVSSDHNEKDFNEFLKEMPWFAIPFSEQERNRQLSKLLRVKSIPTLILLDSATGEVINTHAQNHVTDDPTAAEFPWKPRSLHLAFGDGPFVDSSGHTYHMEHLDGCIKALYFSANWCPPCKAFTPQLVKTYEHLRNKGNRMEIIFVSSDRSKESFDQYFSSMPWLAIPFAEEKRRKELADLLGVQGIPTLIILDESNDILTCDGRYEVIEDPEGKHFPWRPRLVEDLTAKFSSRLQDDPFLVLFTDGNEKELEQARELLLPVAKEFNSSKKGLSTLWYFVAGETEICDSLREFANLEDEVPLLVILDMVNREKFVFEEDVELNVTVVRDFVRHYLDGKLGSRPF